MQNPVSYSIINSVPGLGFILSLTILYEIDDIHRFSDVGKFISYCRLVKCSHESAGKKEKGGHNKIGNVHLKWAFSEGAVFFLRNNERGQRWHDKLVQRYGKAKVRFAIEFCALLYKWTNVEFWIFIFRVAFCFAKIRLFRVALSLHSFATLRNWLRQPLQSLPRFVNQILEIEPK